MTDNQAGATRPLVTADDLYLFHTPSDPQISPDGTQVVFCVQRVERPTEKKVTNLWLADSDGRRLRQFSHGKWADTQPRWSPDGRTLAFVSNRGSEELSLIHI